MGYLNKLKVNLKLFEVNRKRNEQQNNVHLNEYKIKKTKQNNRKSNLF